MMDVQLTNDVSRCLYPFPSPNTDWRYHVPGRAPLPSSSTLRRTRLHLRKPKHP